MSERRYSDLELYRRLLALARPYWPHVAALFVLSLLSTPLTLLTPVPLKIVIDHVVGGEAVSGFLQWAIPSGMAGSSTSLLAFAVVLLLLVAALSELQSLASAWLDTYTGERLVLTLRARLFDRIQRFSLLYHDKRGSTDTTYRILYDAPAIQWIAIHGIIPFVTAMVMLGAMLWVMARIDSQLALVALTVSPLLLLATHAWKGRLRSQWKEVKERQSSALSVVQEVLDALRVVKAFGQEQREHDRFVYRATHGLRAHVRAVVTEKLYALVIAMIVAMGTGLVLWIGTQHVLSGTLSLGSLVLVMAYLGQLYAPLKSLGTTMTTIQNSLVGAERVLTVLDEDLDVPEASDPVAIHRARGAITMENVSFSYERQTSILRDVSFEIAPGTRVGIAGPTGAGKTTLVSLLPRFYDPTSGRILLDGRDVRDYRVADLRDQFSLVLQEPVLFSCSIAENIAYARPDASRHEIEAAAKAAGVHAFIADLPEGYDTEVGQRGMRLSGGERQRVSLARAFLKDAPVLILDEPTSSVDVETEARIMESMQRLMTGRTSFMIAHRRGTIRDSDVLFVLQQGRLTSMKEKDEVREALL